MATGCAAGHTLLVATGTMLQSRRSCLFVMDITDPYQPALLWERLLPGGGSGHTRGIAVDRCVATRESAGCLYLTADFAGGDDAPGIHALALALVTASPLAGPGLPAAGRWPGSPSTAR